jgi:hypothetical protein
MSSNFPDEIGKRFGIIAATLLLSENLDPTCGLKKYILRQDKSMM